VGVDDGAVVLFDEDGPESLVERFLRDRLAGGNRGCAADEDERDQESFQAKLQSA
jgi:hypothetical protein